MEGFEAEEYTLESVREAIRNFHQYCPPDARTPEIEEVLEELYKIEDKLILKNKTLEGYCYDKN